MAKLRPWLRNSLITAALFTAFLVGTPFLIQKLVGDWLLQHGGEQVSIRNVDFNPFTGTLKLEDLHVSSKDDAALSFSEALLDIAWLPLLDRHVTVQAIHLSGFSGIIDNRNPEYLALGNIKLTYLDSTLKLDVLEQWSPDTPADITGRGHINGAAFNLNGLAQQRADAVMTYLVEQGGAIPSQLVSCAPRIQLEDPEAEPRTELLL